MAGFDFGQISKLIGSVMDTDEIDVGRRSLVQLPNGSWVETNPEIPLYEEIPCHLSFNSQDNPDPNAIDVQPIIKSVTINCDVSVDLQAGDLITACKLAPDGEILEMYKSIIGEPETNQSRKSAIMIATTLKANPL
jgi:hypothetical protein